MKRTMSDRISEYERRENAKTNVSSEVADFQILKATGVWLFYLFVTVIVSLSFFEVANGFQEETTKPDPPAKPKALSSEERSNAAWEYRPYEVQVWLSSDGSPGIESNLEQLKTELVRQSELIDPSGWVLSVASTPGEWRWNFLDAMYEPIKFTAELGSLDSLAAMDKLIAVNLRGSIDGYHYEMRELDIRTQQWGPLVEGAASSLGQLDSSVMHGITRAFMPIARVDRVSENDDVFLRARALQACIRPDRTADGGWKVTANTDSPVWIKDNDRFLPVIRKTDRQGNLLKLEPIEYTFLTIESKEEAQVVCSIQSYHRAPLHGRKSKRSQKLALVIRPPARSTTLQLVARGDEPVNLEGYEVWSRRPNQSREEPSEFIGKTDWKGEIEIVPSESGLRILFIKHGNRPLKKLPMLPGLFDHMVSTVPDDEARLYAQGIISGMNSEILNLVAKRRVYEAEIGLALERKDLAEARDLLTRYQELPSPQDLRNLLADEELRLQTQTSDRRELDYITRMFNTLQEVLSSKVVDSREAELREKLQSFSISTAAASN